jgi:hypothetical protein
MDVYSNVTRIVYVPDKYITSIVCYMYRVPKDPDTEWTNICRQSIHAAVAPICQYEDTCTRTTQKFVCDPHYNQTF